MCIRDSWYTLCGMAAAFLALRALLAAPARCLRALLLRLARHAGGPLARLAGGWRRAAQSRLAAARKNRAGKRRRPAVHKKPGQPPTKQLQKRARVLYNSK